MNDDTTTKSKLNSLCKNNSNNKPIAGELTSECDIGGGDDEDKAAAEEEECDMEVWNRLNKSFRQVQSVLDQNNNLIHQVNENHFSKIPDNLEKNVSLIREINGNISKVMSLYSDLSVNFCNVVQERRRVKNGATESISDR